MERLILYNDIVLPASATIPPLSSQTVQGTGLYLLGGQFTVQELCSLVGIGTTRYLLPFPSLTFTGICSSSTPSGSGGTTVLNTIRPSVGLATYANDLIGLFSYCGPASFQGTASPGACGPVVSVTGSSTIELSWDATLSVGYTYTVCIQGNSQTFGVFSEGVLLGTCTAVSGQEQNATFSTPIALIPGITYEVVTVVGEGSLGYSAARDVSSYGAPTQTTTPIVFGVGLTPTHILYTGSYSPTTYGGASFSMSGNEVTYSLSGVTYDGTSEIHIGDWAQYSYTGVTGMTGPAYVTNVTQPSMVTNVFLSIPVDYPFSATSINFNYGNAITILNAIGGVYLNSFWASTTDWAGDYFFHINITDAEPYAFPPPASVTGAPLSFTITLPTAATVGNFQQFDLQYAKSSDNLTYSQWYDIGTFPAQGSSDASDPTTTNQVGVYTHQVPDTVPSTTLLSSTDTGLPYYQYRYSVYTNNSQSDWSVPVFAGQIQNNPTS